MEEKKTKKIEENLSTYGEKCMKNIKNHILKYLNDNNMTLQKLASITDISYSSLNNVLYTDCKDAKLSNVVKYCIATGTSLDEFLEIGTLPQDEVRLLQNYRKLNDRSKYIISWMIEKESSELEYMEAEKYINVFTPIITDDGLIKPSNNISLLDISDIPYEKRAKVYVGMKMNCDFYMPLYTPTDIILIANDRMPRLNETCVITVNGNYFLAQRRFENGVGKYYSIRDGGYRYSDNDIGKIVGYITYVIE